MGRRLGMFGPALGDELRAAPTAASTTPAATAGCSASTTPASAATTTAASAAGVHTQRGGVC